MLCAAPALAAAAPLLEDQLAEARRAGAEIIYSSELVTPGMPAASVVPGLTPLEQARRSLATQGLALRTLSPNTYVVVRAPRLQATSVADPEPPLQEVSVYASRYAIEGGIAPPRQVTPTDLERAPGSHDDALRSLQALPGIVSGASARPYIRGSLSEDILVRYDGIALLDPFHFKNFQSLISAIDPAAIESIEVFSGGFPVRYGTRSGGVIDITAPESQAGQQYRASISLISAGISSQGRAESLPLDWLVAIRRSTLDTLDPIEDGLGRPAFADSLGRIRWTTERGAWTAGWLLLNDSLELGGDDEEEEAEEAEANYREEYLWLARDHRFGDALRMRSSLVVTGAERDRQGTLRRPGVAQGELEERREFSGVELVSDWIWSRGDHAEFYFGGDLGTTRVRYQYQRVSAFSPAVAALFGRQEQEQLDLSVRPQVLTYALYGSYRRRWSRLEAEFGLRADGQHYQQFGSSVQGSPRVNLRYDLTPALRLYGSAGRFTQAQHAEEWRVEEAQQTPDAAQVSLHTILGLSYDHASGARLGVEAYSKRWTTAAPYFDNLLNPFSLLPDLSPDRVRLQPAASEARGLEISLRQPFGPRLTSWGTLAWARVADDFADSRDVLRGWDQTLALTSGLAWKGARASVSAALGWHRGWPRTALTLNPLLLGGRNQDRWRDFYSLDLRGSWTWPLRSGEFSTVLDVTNATNRRNDCCLILRDEGGLTTEVDHWLPTILNIGFTYRWRKKGTSEP